MKKISLLAAGILLTSCLSVDLEERRDELSDVDRDGYWDVQYGGEDCNDNDKDINPGEAETPYDGIDNDCNADTPDDDLDGDTFGIANDCNDEDSAIHPTATEICDEIDNNCNDAIDEAGAEGESTFFADDDGDGYGNDKDTILACSQPENYATNADDCNDEDNLAFPGSPERCSTDYDDNCDSVINEADAEGCTNFFYDGDGDGYGTTEFACLCEADTEGDYDALEGTDCLDTDANANPDGIEVLDDSEDFDCDGGDDTFSFQSVDSRAALDAYGPRLRADGDNFYMTWIAEEYNDGSGASFDGGMLVEFDAENPGVGETDSLSFGTGSNGVNFTNKFDFILTQDYWVVATGGVNGQDRRLRLEFIDRANGNRDTYSNSISTGATWDDVQLAYSPNGTLTAVACGLGNAGLQVLQGTTTHFILASGVYSTLENWPNNVCEYNDNSYAYYIANSVNQTLDYAAYFTNTESFEIYYSLTEYEVADIEVARTATDYITAVAYTNSGKHYITAFNPDNTTNKTMSSEIVDLDVTLTPSGGAAICAVASNGDLSLIYANVADYESLMEVPLNPGVVVDECGIASTNDGRTALAIRSGDNFLIGFVDYL